ncbi:MAG: NfeD family protein [Propionibacteriaceae bacterium]|jgi:membrane protein implicated in regulation of membrane protease activity|nr:NfeD family protein [Propionibacteriaceae bacterium]
MAWVIWIVIAVAFAIAELSVGTFTLLMIAGGCSGGFLVSLIAPNAYWLQTLTAVVLCGLLLGLLRPALRHHASLRSDCVPNLECIVGSYGVVLKNAKGDAVHVKINGKEWNASSVDGAQLLPGTQVFATAFDGTVVLVMPVASKVRQ